MSSDPDDVAHKKRLRALSAIDSYVNIERDFEEAVSRWDAELFGLFRCATFALIGPDGTTPANLPYILSIIEKTGFSVIAVKLYQPVPEILIEHLYKYHVPDAIRSRKEFELASCNFKTYCPYMSMVPTRNWRLLRRRFESGPSIALLMRGDGERDVPKAFAEVKGPTDPLLAVEGQIRNHTDNPVNSFIHSSDDQVSVLREALLFFTEDELRRALRRPAFDPEFLSGMLRACLPDPAEYRFLIVAQRMRLRIALKIYFESGERGLSDYYWSLLESSFQERIGKRMISLATEMFQVEKDWLEQAAASLEAGSAAHGCIALLRQLATPPGRNGFDITSFRLGVLQQHIIATELELLTIEAGLWYYRG